MIKKRIELSKQSSSGKEPIARYYDSRTGKMQELHVDFTEVCGMSKICGFNIVEKNVKQNLNTDKTIMMKKAE